MMKFPGSGFRFRALLLVLGLLTPGTWHVAPAQQTYSGLTIIAKADGSRGTFALRETGGADEFRLQVGGAMSEAYTLRVPLSKPAIGNTLVIDTEPETNVFQAIWGSGGGTCSGNFACKDQENVFTNAPQTIKTATEHAQFKIITDWATVGAVAAMSAFSYAGANRSDGFLFDSITARGSEASPAATESTDTFMRFRAQGYDGSAIQLGGVFGAFPTGNWSGSNRGTYWSWQTVAQGTTSLVERMTIGKDNANGLTLNNDGGIWLKDTGGNARRTFRITSGNDIELGFFGQNVASGDGDLSFWATGSSGNPIGLILDWTSSDTGTFGPDALSSVQLGTAGRPFNSGRLNGVWYIGDDGAIDPQLIIEGVGGSGSTIFTRANAGGTVAHQWPNKNNSGALTNNGTGTMSWSADSGIIIIGTPGAVTGSVVLAHSGGGLSALRGSSTASNGIEIDGPFYASSNNAYQNGLSSRRWSKTWTVDLDFSGTLTGTVDISNNTNLSAASPLTLSGDQVQCSTCVTTNTSQTISGAKTFSSGIIANGGIDTGTTTNSTLRIGSGNFYQRMVGGASTGVSCSGVTDGWTGYSTDDYIVICRGGTRYRVAVASF